MNKLDMNSNPSLYQQGQRSAGVFPDRKRCHLEPLVINRKRKPNRHFERITACTFTTSTSIFQLLQVAFQQPEAEDAQRRPAASYLQHLHIQAAGPYTLSRRPTVSKHFRNVKITDSVFIFPSSRRFAKGLKASARTHIHQPPDMPGQERKSWVKTR